MGNKIYIFHAGSELTVESIRHIELDIIEVNPLSIGFIAKIFRKIRKVFNVNYYKSIDYIFSKFGIIDNDTNVFIFFDSYLWMKNLDYIRTKYPKSKIIFWYWNTISDKILF